MLFTDLTSERIVAAFSKIGFKIIKQEKHIGMSDGMHIEFANYLESLFSFSS